MQQRAASGHIYSTADCVDCPTAAYAACPWTRTGTAACAAFGRACPAAAYAVFARACPTAACAAFGRACPTAACAAFGRASPTAACAAFGRACPAAYAAFGRVCPTAAFAASGLTHTCSKADLAACLCLYSSLRPLDSSVLQAYAASGRVSLL
jgi:hypothetical protein